jgi:hypothetical protein
VLRPLKIAALATTLFAALPSIALAAEPFSSASFGVHLGLSLVGLVIAVLLLVEALTVRKLAQGGAVAERIGLVVLAVVCLAASALAEWGTNFVVDLTLEQTQLASEVLVIVAMGLLAAYFWNVRSTMARYMRASTPAPTSEASDLVDTQSEDADDA